MKNLILTLICLFHFQFLIAKERSSLYSVQATTPIETLVNPDGTLNLYTNFVGSLDLSGYQVSIDACKGIIATPVREPAMLTSSWSPLGLGLNNACYALAIDNSGTVYVGGAFTTAGGSPANRIAKWDGVNWSALGSGLNANCGYLVLDNSGNLYAGGDFTTAGGNPANRIAKWDGANWSALGSGLNNTCSKIAIDNSGNIYTVGGFTTAGGNPASRIAKWDGANWSALGSGFNNWGSSVAIDNNGHVYAGGVFTTAGGNTANRIAKWNGATWLALGSGLNANCSVIKINNSGTIYAGGDFTTAGGNAANRIALWNGSTWSTLSTGFNSVCWAIIIDDNGDVFAGGGFTIAGGISAKRIAKWNGTAWSALGTGFNQECRAIAIDSEGELYADGTFTTADGNAANRIAKWGEAPLPVDLLYFKGAFANNATLLSWATVSEFNNAGFQIEHSLEGKEWEAIDFIKGKGSSLETSNYKYSHQAPKPQLNFYRLKQVGFDGTYEYSNVASVMVDKKEEIRIYPNPTKGKVKIVGTDIERAKFTILDSSNRIVKEYLTANRNVDLSRFPDGVYFIAIDTGHQLITKRIIKE